LKGANNLETVAEGLKSTRSATTNLNVHDDFEQGMIGNSPP